MKTPLLNCRTPEIQKRDDRENINLPTPHLIPSALFPLPSTLHPSWQFPAKQVTGNRNVAGIRLYSSFQAGSHDPSGKYCGY